MHSLMYPSIDLDDANVIQQFNERNAPVFLISLKPAASGWTSNLFASVVDDGNAFGSVPTVDDIRGLLA